MCTVVLGVVVSLAGSCARQLVAEAVPDWRRCDDILQRAEVRETEAQVPCLLGHVPLDPLPLEKPSSWSQSA